MDDFSIFNIFGEYKPGATDETPINDFAMQYQSAETMQFETGTPMEFEVST